MHDELIKLLRYFKKVFFIEIDSVSIYLYALSSFPIGYPGYTGLMPAQCELISKSTLLVNM